MIKHDFVGLSDAEVLQARRQFGTNELPPPELESFWDKLKVSSSPISIKFYTGKL